VPSVEIDTTTKKLLKQTVPELADYDIRVASVGAANCDALIFLKRRVVMADDDGLPNEAVLWKHADKIGYVAREQVDSSRGSGHVRLKALIDYNGDGRVDALLSGDQFKCSYELLFEGIEDGFAPVELPAPSCSC
jgi:hypothetical protein